MPKKISGTNSECDGKLPWHAVRIMSYSLSCDAARKLADQWFLSGDAPALPLAGCTLPKECTCMFRKQPDRCNGPRRDEDATGIRRFSLPPDDRRAKRGRRKADYEE